MKKNSTMSKKDKASTKKKSKSKGKKVIAIIMAIIVLLLSGGCFFVCHKLGMVNTKDSYMGEAEKKDTIDISAISGCVDGSSLNALLKSWYENNGSLMNSNDIRNIMLLGIDSKSKLSDSMILASINEKTENITLTSFYRDSYTYMNENGAEYFAKMNAAYINGGAPLVVKTIENDYKIKIDDYVVVDYQTFPKIIDAIGGVDVEVTEKEANYLNNTWYKWTQTGNPISFHSGTMHMDGEHALMFSRIRKLDSDIGRTERQRRVLMALMNKFKDASVSEMNRTIDTVLPSLTTSMKKRKILSLASRAISNNWADYKVDQLQMPEEDTRAEGYVGDQWIWFCDYEGAAYELQVKIYGESNIVLKRNRITALHYARSK